MTSCRYSTKQFYVNSCTVTKRGREWKDIDGRYKQLKHNHRNYGVRTLVVPVVSICGTWTRRWKKYTSNLSLSVNCHFATRGSPSVCNTNVSVSAAVEERQVGTERRVRGRVHKTEKGDY